MIIVGFGILASVAARFSMFAASEGRRQKAIQRMDEILIGIYGDPDVVPQSHFGFIGDTAELPPVVELVDALYSGKGAGTNWDGPYISLGFDEEEVNINYDPWGQLYVVDFNAGTITSTGSGSDMVLNFHYSQTKLLDNTLEVIVKDRNDNYPKPGSYSDLTGWLYRVGNQASKNNLKEKINSYTGSFVFTDVAVGNLRLEVKYAPDNVTKVKYVTILPTGGIQEVIIKFTTIFP